MGKLFPAGIRAASPWFKGSLLGVPHPQVEGQKTRKGLKWGEKMGASRASATSAPTTEQRWTLLTPHFIDFPLFLQEEDNTLGC